MEESLPRVWQAVEGGLAEPLRPLISHGHPARIGGDYEAGLVMTHLDELESGVDNNVLAPLRRWQEGLAVAKVRRARVLCCALRAVRAVLAPLCRAAWAWRCVIMVRPPSCTLTDAAAQRSCCVCVCHACCA